MIVAQPEKKKEVDAIRRMKRGFRDMDFVGFMGLGLNNIVKISGNCKLLPRPYAPFDPPVRFKPHHCYPQTK